MATLTVWPLSGYGFGSKADPSVARDRSESARIERLRARFAVEGTRRSVAALLVVHEHGHPHLLLLQDLSVRATASAGVGSGAAAPSGLPLPPSSFRLPGGRLRPGEDEVSGLARKLRARLSPPAAAPLSTAAAARWDVPRERAGALYRPAFEPELYPYCPAHCTVPKEETSLRVVPLPEKLSFAVPEGMRLVAVPLMDLFAGGASKFGAPAAAAPSLLSRFAMSLAAPSASEPKVGLPPPDDGRMWKKERKGEEERGGEADDGAIVVVGGGKVAEASAAAASPSKSSSPPGEEEKS